VKVTAARQKNSLESSHNVRKRHSNTSERDNRGAPYGVPRLGSGVVLQIISVK
jgi:hypothetical protein